LGLGREKVKVSDRVRARVKVTAKDNGCNVDMFTDIAL
jgi:hypothetical protein